jgi:hypothetical protein
VDFRRERDIADDVRYGLQLFVVAVKNCALYPENSKIRRASLDRLQEWFTRFLDDHETLKLFVDMDSFLFQGVQVFQEKPGDSAVVFPFFRDGVQWIEFLEGMELGELAVFIEKMNRFRMLREDDEDDLVTALWDADLQFIKYKTANEFWEIDPVTEIASFQVSVGGGSSGQATKTEAMARKSVSAAARSQGPRQAGGKALGALLSWMRDSGKGSGSPLFQADGELVPPETGLGEEDDSGGGSGADDDLQDYSWRHQPWAINPREKAEMDNLLSAEARRSHLGLGIDLTLALLLHNRHDQDGQATVMKFLAEMVKFAFARGDFGVPVFVLGKLEVIIRRHSPALDHIRTEFPRWLAAEPVMEGLSSLEPRKGGLSEQESAWFRQFLSVLPADSSRVLAWAASKCREDSARAILLEAVADRAPAGGYELGIHLNTTLDVRDLAIFLGLLKSRDIKDYVSLLTALSRHVQRQVREGASRLLLERSSDLIAQVPHLLSEPDPALARQIFWQLGQRRTPIVEKSLIQFLTQTRELSISRSPEQILQCYRTLGLAAASSRAAEFVSGILLRKDFKSLFGMDTEIDKTHRAGAALALHFMPAQYGAREILSRASRSLFRSLRAACLLAEREAEAYKAMANRG